MWAVDDRNTRPVAVRAVGNGLVTASVANEGSRGACRVEPLTAAFSY